MLLLYLYLFIFLKRGRRRRNYITQVCKDFGVQTYVEMKKMLRTYLYLFFKKEGDEDVTTSHTYAKTSELELRGDEGKC